MRASTQVSERNLVLFFVVAAAAIIAFQLLVPPVVGLANNGDFESVMSPVGLKYFTEEHSEKYFSWIVTRFGFAEPGWHPTGLVTSEVPLAWLARFVSEPFARAFDLRVLGAIHGLLLVTGLALLVSAAGRLGRAAQWTAAAALLFFFTDIGYVAPLNSFFSQAASLVFLMLTLGVAARTIAFGRRDLRHTAAFFLCAGLFVSSKPQEALQGVLLAAFGLRLYGRRDRPVLKQAAPFAAAALVAFAGWYLSLTPPAISEVARYHKVFMELLPNSPTPARDLQDLGLDPAWIDAVGKIAYRPGPFWDPAFRAEFLARFGYMKLVGFYATHPARLGATLARGGQQALRLRHPRFGNFEHRAGVAPGAKATGFSLWSSARLRLPGNPLLWLVPLFVGNAVLAFATDRRAAPDGRLAREGIVLLVAMGTGAFLICVLSNAHGDLPRHFYTFQALTDLLLAVDATWIASRLATRGAAGATGIATRPVSVRGMTR
ncbi:MAG TPA: hypothetical protein VFA98_13440 [Thermoanaerobaculia bacterium]|jgi:hypothetical protein|nr:hypothetical protein [Thermoanaerobaculia bacterium]